MLQFDDFCRSTGLDHATVENLMRTDLFAISMWRDEERTRPFGIFDDALPSREELVARGLPVKEDYDPEVLRSVEEYEDEDPDDDSGPIQTLTWGQ